MEDRASRKRYVKSDIKALTGAWTSTVNRAIARAGVTTKRMTRLEAKRVIWEIWAMRGKGIQRATLKWAREAQKGMSSSANPPDESPDDSRAG